MTNTAIVKKIDGNTVTVVTVRNGACGENCAMCGGCKGEQVFTKAYCDIDVKPGDAVVIESNTASVLFALSAVFIFPIIIPIILFMLFYRFNAVLCYVITAFGAVTAVAFIAYLSKSSSFNRKITPKIISVLKK